MKNRKPALTDLDVGELHAIIKRSGTAPLDVKDRELLTSIVETLSWVMNMLEKAHTTLAFLRKSFSINKKKTEKTSEVLKRLEKEAEQPAGEEKEKEKEKKGHGRNGADAYTGAEKLCVSHESLKPGDVCPKCGGKLSLKEPVRLVRLKGQAPLQSTIWEVERLRCNLCGEVFTATPPADIGKEKYDETSASMIALLRYGSGLPFNRLAGLERNFGIPLPVSTQWDIVEPGAMIAMPVYDEMVRQVAQGSIIHHDDTSMKILTLLKENQRIEREGSKERVGIFTSGFVALSAGRKIVVFITGRRHGGENLKDVLAKRSSDLAAPIQMCDGSSMNESENTLVANCLTHGRRKFVEVAESFPRACRSVLKTLRKIYKNDDETRKREMSPEDRLEYHQKHSAKPMKALRRWMIYQLQKKHVEPNSSLGGAFAYMLQRWEALTLFLRIPGAPLDNNICERALKKAISHRKNSLFYKTENGARVGDIYMSLIYTAELAGENPFDYLVALLKHPVEVRSAPQHWLPWNYRETFAALGERRAMSSS